jgi:hypothetical protein
MAAITEQAVTALTPGIEKQAPHLGRAEHLASDLALHDRDFAIHQIDLAKAAVDREALVGRQFKRGQPGAAPDTEQIAHRPTADKAPVEHGMDLMLLAGALVHQLHPA